MLFYRKTGCKSYQSLLQYFKKKDATLSNKVKHHKVKLKEETKELTLIKRIEIALYGDFSSSKNRFDSGASIRGYCQKLLELARGLTSVS